MTDGVCSRFFYELTRDTTYLIYITEPTSEEITAKRRADRKQFKIDRARAIAAVAEEAEVIFATEGRVIQPALSGPAIPSSSTWKPSVDPQTMDNVLATTEEELPCVGSDNGKPLVDIEHLQLTLQEAFFLCWNLDCLTILDPQTVSIPKPT